MSVTPSKPPAGHRIPISVNVRITENGRFVIKNLPKLNEAAPPKPAADPKQGK